MSQSQDQQQYDNYQDGKEPRHVIAQYLDPVADFATQMGIVNYRLNYGHVFDGLEVVAEHFVDAFDDWVKQIARLDLPVDPRTGFKIPKELPPNLVKEIKQIWYGKTWYYCIRDSSGEITSDRILFDDPKGVLQEDEDSFELPALLHLNPKSSLKNDSDPRVLIQEAVDFDVAWAGYEPSQLASFVEFVLEDDEGTHAIFENDADVMSSDAQTLEISREVYAKLIRFEKIEMLARKTRLWSLAKNILSTYKYTLNFNKYMSELSD
ncbi:MAG: hypothetical protein UT24_C0024G0006 [Candidatus Woesebacteria bacterium GW2011_GWB1_39_12]|uniref:Uncharacterized protein n=1 Tax=Candidatus Woesebacteria bacterium GW2011_GWB1_39_12 TaxID=1618574 RepID=A0A0G0QCC5_9BACT|nr:MAG: hypothetical protein UT24_C0024G0006 [Candidatus Woesebacteria bacterium GW2011_GWB1_39_12]